MQTTVACMNMREHAHALHSDNDQWQHVSGIKPHVQYF